MAPMTYAQAVEQRHVVRSFPSVCKAALLEAGWRVGFGWPLGVLPSKHWWSAPGDEERLFTLEQAWALHMLAGELRTAKQLSWLVPGFTGQQANAVLRLQRDQHGLNAGSQADLQV